MLCVTWGIRWVTWNSFEFNASNCISDLKLVPAWPEYSQLAFNSIQQNWHHPGSEPRSRPRETLITSGWQYCYMEPLGCDEGLTSSLKVERPHHFMDRSLQVAPKDNVSTVPKAPRTILQEDRWVWIMRRPRKLFIQIIFPQSCHNMPGVSQ